MLARRDPFREMMTLRHAMDRLFDSAFVGPQDVAQESGWSSLAMDVSENEDAYMVKATMAGVRPEDIEITYQGNTLTIKGEAKEEKETEGEQYHIRERRFGTFSRSITLPSNIQADRIEAASENGVLTIRLPKAEEAKPKRISIQAKESPKTIEAGAGRSK